ncbi:hypothetical protein [Desulfovibrio legallii]|uniref:Uncharacterized protein n=1 Tax=Desulfovibrio legallii TaxID=571438 RepID=A0A6H3F8X5_9BACT|nr:hypothetical protein [Desulfovibrio legallii]TBH79554.1 hypothetical protein EB812_08165 [Desulfovibrio legallii]
MATKFRITINLDIDEYEALQRISENTERSLAWLGRRAICDYINLQYGDNSCQPTKSNHTLLAGRQIKS